MTCKEFREGVKGLPMIAQPFIEHLQDCDDCMNWLGQNRSKNDKESQSPHPEVGIQPKLGDSSP